MTIEQAGNKSIVEEKILLNRRLLIGKTKATSYDPRQYNVYLEAQIKERNPLSRSPRSFVNLKPLKKYKTLSISGSSKNFGGQIYDELTEDNIEFAIPKERVSEIKSIWRKWHLNDLHAGTKKQEEALRKIGGVNANKYTEQLEFLKKKRLKKHKGYVFGTDWLVEELPEDVEKKIMKLF